MGLEFNVNDSIKTKYGEVEVPFEAIYVYIKSSGYPMINQQLLTIKTIGAVRSRGQ